MTLKGTKSFKEASQVGLFLVEDHFPILIGGKPIALKSIQALWDLDFESQLEKVHELGFDLLVKRARVNSTQHVRVRPMFDGWEIRGHVDIVAPEIKEPDLKKMFEIAGFYKGLGDWRPGSPKSPGRFGRFNPTLTLLNGKKSKVA
jgi:hypothetical protein